MIRDSDERVAVNVRELNEANRQIKNELNEANRQHEKELNKANLQYEKELNESNRRIDILTLQIVSINHSIGIFPLLKCVLLWTMVKTSILFKQILKTALRYS